MIQKFEDFGVNETDRTKLAKESADSRFKLHINAIKENIKILQAAVADMEKKQSMDNPNWGFAGSADKVNTDLVDIIEFLGEEGVTVKPYKR